MEKRNFQTNEYYHIYNRGVEKRKIYINKHDYKRFLLSLNEFNTNFPIGSIYDKNILNRGVRLPQGESDTPIVKILCYCLNPNHYHLIIKQTVENGISNYMKKLGTGYTNYFNKKYKRSGSLFQGRFKAKHIKSSYYLEYLFAYIHGNPEIHSNINAQKWPWSNYKKFIEIKNIINNDNIKIFNNYKTIENYQKYVNMVINESKNKKIDLKKYLFE